MFAKFRRTFGSLAIALLIASAAVLWVASGSLFGESAPEARKEPAHLAAQQKVPQVRVHTQTAEMHTNRLTVQGRTQADRKVTIRAQTHGRVDQLLVKQGDRIKKGQVLAQLAEEDRPAQLRQAQALLEQRRLELEAARQLNEKGYRATTQLAAARADFQDAQAAVELAKVELDNTTIYAPFAGEVGETMIEEGDFLSSGSDVLRLIDLDPIRIVGDVNERNVAGIQLGAEARAELVTDETVTGEVTFIANEANESTRTFRIEVEASNSDGLLRDGVTAKLSLPLHARKAHFVSPSILTLNDEGTVGVKLIDERNRVSFHEVDLLADQPDGVWISGLPEEVTFITVGQNFVSVGQEVDPVEEAEVMERLKDTPLSLPEGAPGKPGPEARP